MKCQSCGKSKALKRGTEKIRLVLCPDCEKDLLWELNDHNVPVIWVGEEDVKAHILEGEQKKLELTRKNLEGLADRMSDHYWNSEHDDYGDSLEDAWESLREELERRMLEGLPDEQLPLHINDGLFPNNRPFLEERLKKCTTSPTGQS